MPKHADIIIIFASWCHVIVLIGFLCQLLITFLFYVFTVYAVYGLLL